jgi:signal transduction histidine kinase
MPFSAALPMSGAKLFNRLRYNLRRSIFTAFSVLLFISFVMVGGIFNIAVREYIRQNAIAELDEAQKIYAYDGIFTVVTHSGLFGKHTNYFYIDRYYHVNRIFISANTDNIAAYIKNNNIHPELLINRRVRTDGGTFYVTAKPVSREDPNWYAVFYVDITDISRFSNRINLLLLFLVVIIWCAAMIIATFLAGSLSHPLRVLNHFARRIGRGDFTQSDENFTNDEFEAINQSLNHTAKQLAKYDNDQKTFFQNVSHELRTPLMSIKSYAEGIKYGIMDNQKASETIIESANRLANMVDDIMYMSRIDNITTPDESLVDLRDLVAERIRISETPSQKIKINFHHDSEPVMVSCIQSYIERAMDNLISNALRYAETTIDITCNGVGQKAVIRVIDDGPGFAPDALPHVFERFYRSKNGLTGIGLAIVKSIIDQHKGVTLAENKEKGAMLTICIPRK